MCAKSRDETATYRGDAGLVAKWFSSLDVRHVNFDGWQADRRDCVPQSDACMRVGGGVEHDYVELPFCLLNPAYQVALDVSLAKINSHTQFAGSRAHGSFDVRQRRASINLRLARSEQV